ncbi:MAG: hypothetical protein KA198_03890, partial [Chitinophagaceae bacterium]|nr:hypothetical protein [Chitinophagaceae bacterium]
SIGLGNNAEAPATGAIALGENANASGLHSMAFGNGSAASANYSTAIGHNTQAKGLSSYATGFATIANGAYSMSHGVGTNAYGNASIALGNLCIVRGTNALASGESLIANGFSSTVVGRFNDTLVAEESSIQSTTPLFMVGNGSSSTNRHNAMVVRNDNRVGINTSSPATTLDINGQIKISGGAPGAGKVLTSDANGLATWETAVPGPQGPQGIQGLTGATGAQGPAGSANMSGTSNYLVRFSGSTSGVNSQVVDNGTNVGIGTSSSPISKLHVQSSTSLSDLRLTNSTTGSSATDGLQIYNSGTQASILNKENASLDFGTNNLTRMTLDASGNVGIGISNPGAKLDVNGQVKISGGTPGTGKVLTSDANGLASWATPVVPASDVSGTSNFLIKFNGTSSGINSQVQDNGTNVGIGANNAPISKLHINENTALQDLRITTSNTGHTAADGLVMEVNAADARIINKENAPLQLGTRDTVRMTISGGGKIGINTISPNASMDIVAPSINTTPLLVRNQNMDTLFNVRNDGKVGIGYNATSLGRSLNINGNGINFYNKTIPNPNGTLGGVIYPTDTSLVVESALGNQLILQPNQGNVGIATASPTSTLDINGTLRIRGGNPGNGKILISNNEGEASWTTPPTIPNSLNDLYNNGNGRVINASNGCVKIEGDGLYVRGEIGSGHSVDYSFFPLNSSHMFFNTVKGAFRAGAFAYNNWNIDSIGLYSVAMGTGCLAKGISSIAMGSSCEALFPNSIAIGEFCKATALSSVALGEESTSTGVGSFAAGSHNVASANFSIAIGHYSEANSPMSFVGGYLTKTEAQASAAFGSYNQSNGYSGMVIGYANDTILAPQTALTPETPLFIIGNGASASMPSNAMVVQYDGNVGIGENSPKSKLVLNGALAMKLNKVPGIGSVTLDNTASVWYLTGSASVVLPTASDCTNRVYTIMNRSTSVRTISNYTNMSGAVSSTIGANMSIEIISDGTNWLQLR